MHFIVCKLYLNKIRVLEGKQTVWMMYVHPCWAQLRTQRPKAQASTEVYLRHLGESRQETDIPPHFPSSLNEATKRGNLYMLPNSKKQ